MSKGLTGSSGGLGPVGGGDDGIFEGCRVSPHLTWATPQPLHRTPKPVPHVFQRIGSITRQFRPVGLASPGQKAASQATWRASDRVTDTRMAGFRATLRRDEDAHERSIC